MHLIATLAIVASGLHGIVMKGPTSPVCRTGVPCSAPAQVTLLFHRTGPTPRLYRTRSTATGAYRIALPAGYYTVTTAEKDRDHAATSARSASTSAPATRTR